MKKEKIKKIIIIVLFLILASVIFFFSNQDGSSSIKVSDSFTKSVIDKYANVFKEDYTPKEKVKIVVRSRFIVRKLAHFTIYLILGILVYAFLRCYKIKHTLMISIIFCFVFACGDEFHQIFTPGRTARFYDVVIDTIGCFSGMCLTNLIIKLKKNIKTKKKEVKKYA